MPDLPGDVHSKPFLEISHPKSIISLHKLTLFCRFVGVNLETLYLYCDVIRSNSFSLGAAAHQISQSAASQSVRQLEQELGVQLIDRTKRPFMTTREGTIFYEACQEMVKCFEQAKAEISTQRSRIEGTVRVAVIYSVGLQDMGWYTQQFMSLYGRARIRLSYLHPDEVVEAVLSDAADLGILSFPNVNRSLTIIPWHSEPMVLICSRTHSLAANRLVTASEVAAQRFVAFDKTLSIRKSIDRALRARGFKANISMQFDNIETIKQAITTQSAVSILPRPSVTREVEEGSLSAIPLDMPELIRPIGIVHRRQKVLTPTTAALLEFLEKYRPGDRVGGSGS
jgi:DNA-binding transcriptional LysR family regulator